MTPRLRTEEPHATARAHLNDVFIAPLEVVDIFRELHPTKNVGLAWTPRTRISRS